MVLALPDQQTRQPEANRLLHKTAMGPDNQCGDSEPHPLWGCGEVPRRQVP